MSFPFGGSLGSLRQRMLLAVSSGSMLGLGAFGCSATDGRPDGMNAGRGGPASSSLNAGMGAGSGGRSNTTGTGGSVATGGAGSVPIVVGGSGGRHGGSGGDTGAGGSQSNGGSGGMIGGAGMMSAAGVGGVGGTAGMGTGGMMSEPSCGLGNPPVMQCLTRAEMEDKAHFGCGMIATTPEPTPEQIADAFLENGCLPKTMACDGCCNPAAVEGTPGDDGSCCYAYCTGACCGRPFTVDGAGRLAGVATRSDWLVSARAPSVPTLISTLTGRIASEWLEDARMEHASIASFARFTLELLGLGAPASLVEHAQRAALDEVEHARACFSLASRFAGQAYGPAALRVDDATPAQTLPEAAARAFLEGCVGETIAAAHARAALEHARDPEVRWALSRIAEDEARHAELAWRFVAWALTQDAAAVAPALWDALLQARPSSTLHAALPGALPGSERELPDALAALHAAGRLSQLERSELTEAALVEVVLPCAQALLARVEEPLEERAA